MSKDVVFSENIPFFYAPPLSTSHEGEEEWLVYQVTHALKEQLSDVPSSPSSSFENQSTIVPSESSSSVLGKPLIFQVYSRKKETNETCDMLVPSSSYLPPSYSSENLDLHIALHKGTYTCKSTYPFANFVSYDHLSSTSTSLIVSLDSNFVPKTVKEALHHHRWYAAMLKKIHALDENLTWDLVGLPKGRKPVGCKWVFTVNVNPDGCVTRLKARLVDKGYAQIYGMDYFDTFSPMAKLTSVRLFISQVASDKWPLHQLDIKNAVLQCDFQEEVYMEQPTNFVAHWGMEKIIT